MTKEEAIQYNKNLREYMRITDKESEYKFLEENYIALDMAIKALEQEPFKPMVEIDLYSVIKQKYIEREVLDKIRAEIEDIAFDWQEIDGEHESFMVVDLNNALNIIDRYRAESEGE